MTDQDNSYRPRSPDFSSFSGNFSQQPTADSFNQSAYVPPPQLTPQASYDASPFFNPHVPRHSVSYYQQAPYIPDFAEMPPQTRSRSLQQQQQLQQLSLQEQYEPQQQYAHRAKQQQQPQPAQEDRRPSSEYTPSQYDKRSYTNSQPKGKGKGKGDAPLVPPSDPSEGPSMGIEIKTKFPVARIKRIMQADEDVGKVSQVTPVAVSKALELFMISLVTKAAQQARDRSSKRITAGHLKEAILKDEVLDFLADIISKVPDQPAKKDEDGSDHDEHRKRKGGGVRRKKEEFDV